MDNYRSMIDFLFCELFEQYRGKCFSFYLDDEKPMLKNILSHDQIKKYDYIMVQSLRLAHKIMSEKRMESWCWFKSMVLKHCA